MRIKRILPVCFAAVIALHAQVAMADALPPVYVNEGNDDAQLTNCSLSYSAASATAEATLRYNHITVAQANDYMADRAIALVISLNGFEITRGDNVGTGTCAINMQVSLLTFTKTFDPVHQNVKWATVHYCDREMLFTLSKLSSQSIVDEKVTEFTNQCLAQYEKLKNV